MVNYELLGIEKVANSEHSGRMPTMNQRAEQPNLVAKEAQLCTITSSWSCSDDVPDEKLRREKERRRALILARGELCECGPGIDQTF